MIRWEYKVAYIDMLADALPAEEQLNIYGQDGWELVAVGGNNGYVSFFKRPLSEDRDYQDMIYKGNDSYISLESNNYLTVDSKLKEMIDKPTIRMSDFDSNTTSQNGVVDDDDNAGC